MMTDIIRQEPNNIDKPVEARVAEDGRVLVQFDESTFGEFVSDVLSEKQLLERTYHGAIVLRREELLEFHHLIHQKMEAQANIFLDTLSMRVFYESGESHTLHGFDEIQEYTEPRNIVPNRISLEWKFFTRGSADKELKKTDLALTVQALESPRLGEITIAIRHNDRLFANEIVQLLNPLVERVVQSPGVLNKLHEILTMIMRASWAPLFWVTLILGFLASISLDALPGIVRLTDASQRIIDRANDLVTTHKRLLREHDERADTHIEAAREVLIDIENPGRSFRDRVLTSKPTIGTKAAYTYLLLSPHYDNLATGFNDYELNRHQELYGEDPDPLVYAGFEKYKMPA